MSGASCGGGGTSAPDATFRWTVPATAAYTIDTLGSDFDTILYVRSGTCGGTELACNDDVGGGIRQSQVLLNLQQGQVIVIVVDGFGFSSGNYVLNINPLTTPTPAFTATPTPTSTSQPTLTPTFTKPATSTPTQLLTSTPTWTTVPTSTPTLGMPVIDRVDSTGATGRGPLNAGIEIWTVTANDTVNTELGFATSSPDGLFSVVISPTPGMILVAINAAPGTLNPGSSTTTTASDGQPVALIPPTLDIDTDGHVDVATDLVYIARTLLGLPAAPANFRTIDPAILPDVLLSARVYACGDPATPLCQCGHAFDVDGNGQVDAATDLVYIARHELGLPEAPASFRRLDPSIPKDAVIAANIENGISGNAPVTACPTP